MMSQSFGVAVGSETLQASEQGKLRPDPPLEVGFDVLLAAIESRAGAITTDMTRAYLAEIPEFADRTDEDTEQMGSHSLAAIRAAITMVRSGRISMPEEFRAVFVSLGRKRAEENFPLHALVQTFHIGSKVMFNHAIQEALKMGPGGTAVLAPMASLAFDVIAQGVAIVSESYLLRRQEIDAERRSSPDSEMERLLFEPGPVSRRVEETLDQIVDELIDAFRAQIPSYAGAPAEMINDIRTGVRESVISALGVLRGDLAFADFDAHMVERGKKRAEQGVPPQDMLLSFHLGVRRLWEALLEAAPEEPEQRCQLLVRATRAAFKMLQLVSVGQAAVHEGVANGHWTDDEHDLQCVVEVLIGVRQADLHHQERALRRGINLTALRWCVAIHTSPADEGKLVRELRRRLPRAPVAAIDDMVVAFVPGDGAPCLPDFSPMGIASHQDPAAAFRRARGACRVAVHLKKRAVNYFDVVPMALVLDAPAQEREAFVEATLGELLHDPKGCDLLRTLAVFYRTGQSIATSARVLHLHRHSLEYRLQRISALLGNDPRNPDTRLLIELALALHDQGTCAPAEIGHP